MRRRRCIVVVVTFCACSPAAAFGDDGWTDLLPPPVPPAEAPAASPAAAQGSAPSVGQGVGQSTPGPKGDKGDKGDQGIPGPQGAPGVNADLCANLPGIQTSAGWKRWPQRYWTFKPRLERRVLALNRKGQIVCVTLSWVKRHGWRR